MAASFDVAARLAEGRAAVDTTQSYVWACHLLNYQNADLTLHSAQIRDWYSSEDGLDLQVLDADHSALQAVSAAADDAVRRQRTQLDSLAAAWQGDGAASAQDFVRRHCDNAESVAAALRTASDALAGLRDALWAIVDKKVATVVAIDDRRQAQRPAWLGAAQTVITGVGDRATASEVVDQQVKPFVDNDIRADWLAAVGTAIASIGSSYDAATAGLTSAEPVQFDVPGDLGPQPQPQTQPSADGPVATTQAAAAPAAQAPSSSPPSAPAPAPASSSPMPAMAPMQIPAMPSMPSMPSGVGATPASAMPATPAAPSGLEGLGQRLADVLDGLLPTPEPADPAEPAAGDEPEPEPEDEDEADEAETGYSPTEHKEGEPAPVADVDEPEPEPLADPAPEVPPPPEPAAPAPPAPAPPAPEAGTPCEIAADELPQAGQ